MDLTELNAELLKLRMEFESLPREIARLQARAVAFYDKYLSAEADVISASNRLEYLPRRIAELESAIQTEIERRNIAIVRGLINRAARKRGFTDASALIEYLVSAHGIDEAKRIIMQLEV